MATEHTLNHEFMTCPRKLVSLSLSIYDEVSYTIIGERTKKQFRIGDPVRIKVNNVNVDFREIDFELLYKIEDEISE